MNLCPVFYITFDEDIDLTAHIRAQKCTKSTEKPDTESITAQQERKLRKKDSRAQSEEERWSKVYRIVFALGENVEIPSPCKSRRLWFMVGTYQ